MTKILFSPRILFGLLIIVAAGAAILTGATGAFFSDNETSSGNTFAAGAFDLKIDNDSYYNGNRCTFLDEQATTTPGYYWQGNAGYPVPDSSCETSFPLSDLDDGFLFFNFTDLKPDDEGEDTISIHVQNDAYACMEVALTSNDDRSSTEPELEVDAQNTDDAWDGELAQNIQFFWWADDGDNVYEVGENPLTESNGVETLYDLATTTPWKVALADSQNNVWDGVPGPILADETPYYIGKAWCFGTMTLDPVPNPGNLPNGAGVNPSVDPGVNCDGSGLNNKTQSDGATLDVAFSAVQARHNGEFLCDETSRMATITVTKVVVNDNGGNNVVGDFQLVVDNGTVTTPVSSGVPTMVAAGNYTATETGVIGYVASFLNLTDDCDANGQLILAPGKSKTCEITNNDLPANITLFKNVVGGAAGPTLFGLRIDGNLVQHNSSVAVTSNTPHTINEDGRAGYTFTSITGAPECPLVLGGTATLTEGQAITCTITNTAN